MTRGEFYFNRYKSCGDLADVMVKALPEAMKIIVNGKVINWPEEELQPSGPIIVCFEDGSCLKVADVPSPLSKNVKITWGRYDYDQYVD